MELLELFELFELLQPDCGPHSGPLQVSSAGRIPSRAIPRRRRRSPRRLILDFP